MPGKKKVKLKNTANANEKNKNMKKINEQLHSDIERMTNKHIEEIHNAIQEENIEKLETLLSTEFLKIDQISDKIPISFNPFKVLEKAVLNSKARTVNYLLEKFCNPNSKHKISIHDLNRVFAFTAMEQQDESIFLSLIKYGADPNYSEGVIGVCKNDDNNSNFQLTIKSSLALASAILGSNIPAIKFLIHGNHVNIKNWYDNEHHSALQFAIKYKREKIANYFIDNKLVDLENLNIKGCTALLWAMMSKQDSIVNKLLDAKASLDAFNSLNLNFSSMRRKPNDFRSQFYLLHTFNKIHEALFEYRLSLNDEKRKEVEIIEINLAKAIHQIDLEAVKWDEAGSILISYIMRPKLTHDLAQHAIYLSVKQKNSLNKLLQPKTISISLSKNDFITIVQAVQKIYKEDERYLIVNAGNCIMNNSKEFKRASEELNTNLDKLIGRYKHKLTGINDLKKTAGEILLLSNLKKQVETALMLVADSDEKEIQKKIVDALQDCNLLEKNQQICFMGGKPINEISDKENSSKHKGKFVEYTIPRERFLTAIQEIYNVYKTNKNSNLRSIVFTALMSQTNEIQSIYSQGIDSVKEKYSSIEKDYRERLSEFDNKIMPIVFTDLDNARNQIENMFFELERFVDNFLSQAEVAKMDEISIKNNKKYNRLMKIENELLSLEKSYVNIVEEFNAIKSNSAKFLTDIHEIQISFNHRKIVPKIKVPDQASKYLSVTIHQTADEDSQNKLLSDEELPDIEQQFSLFLNESIKLPKDIALFQEKIKQLLLNIEEQKREIELYQSHNSLSLDSTKAITPSFNKKLEDSEAFLQRKIKETKSLAKQDALKEDKLQSKEEHLKKLAIEKEKMLKASELVKQNAMKQEKFERLNSAIITKIENEPTHKPSQLTIHSTTDILPKLAVHQDLITLKNILAQIKSSFDQNKTTIEELTIERSALLCLTARLMEGIKGFAATSLFSATQAEQIRNAIFHYREMIFTDPVFNSPSLASSTETTLPEIRKVNASIIEMVSRIVSFIEDESAQRNCKGNWEKINTYLNSALLNQILTINLTPRTDLNVILTQLSKAETRLSQFQKYQCLDQRNLDDEVIKCAIYSAYAEVGAFAADYKRINRKMYDNALTKMNKLYEIYIEYGNDVRHGRTPNVQIKPRLNYKF